ncbi:MAG: acyl-CoA dehydrogenase family protein [Anaerolineales bacterium]
MDFSWNAEQRALREKVVEFARRELNQNVGDRDRQGLFPPELWRQFGAAGLLGLNVPADYGGQGFDALTTTLALEALGYGCHDNGLTFAVSGQVTSIAPTLASFANAEQKRRYLPGLCSGELIGCYAMTEPDTGSDAYNLRTTAVKGEGGYVLNGQKMFITFGPVADFALVYALTNPNAGKWGLSLFIVDRGTPGFEQSLATEKLGLRTVPMGNLSFNDCVVPTGNLIGREGAGASIFNGSQEWERACILACQIGMMERQLDDNLRFARERQAFGQPIGKFQSVSNRIADMKLRLETARLLTYKAAWLKQTGQPVMLDAALANLHLGETFLESSIASIRNHGARGYVTEFEVERDLRDAMGGPIYGGTADIQRNIVARLLGL